MNKKVIIAILVLFQSLNSYTQEYSIFGEWIGLYKMEIGHLERVNEIEFKDTIILDSVTGKYNIIEEVIENNKPIEYSPEIDTLIYWNTTLLKINKNNVINYYNFGEDRTETYSLSVKNNDTIVKYNDSLLGIISYVHKPEHLKIQIQSPQQKSQITKYYIRNFTSQVKENLQGIRKIFLHNSWKSINDLGAPYPDEYDEVILKFLDDLRVSMTTTKNDDVKNINGSWELVEFEDDFYLYMGFPFPGVDQIVEVSKKRIVLKIQSVQDKNLKTIILENQRK